MTNKITMEFEITPAMYIFATAWVGQVYVLPRENLEDLNKIVKQFIYDNGFEALKEQDPYFLDDFEETATMFIERSKVIVSKIAPELFKD